MAEQEETAEKHNLEQLFQDEHGTLHLRDSTLYDYENVGKIRTITLKNPFYAWEEKKRRDKEGQILIPKDIDGFHANAVVVSEFNGATQKVVEVEGIEVMLSVYAVQFYNIL